MGRHSAPEDPDTTTRVVVRIPPANPEDPPQDIEITEVED